MEQVLLFDIFFKEDPHLNAVEWKYLILFIVLDQIFFSSKISNLLFPLAADGAEGRESYPINDIPNKMPMTFFNDLFIYFVVVFHCSSK